MAYLEVDFTLAELVELVDHVLLLHVFRNVANEQTHPSLFAAALIYYILYLQ